MVQKTLVRTNSNKVSTRSLRNLSMTEEDLQSAIIELAQLYGWHIHHVRPARSIRGWWTPVQGNIGFCDLVLAKDGCVIFAELKSERGRIRPEQVEWMHALSGENWKSGEISPSFREVDGGKWIAVVLWRPRDWSSGVIETVLRGGGQSSTNKNSGR